jgi:hypothetical protein
VREVFALATKYPNGFAIRVHSLGDFYSVQYVNLWRVMLDMVPQLHVFGFTARVDADDPIAHAVADLARDRWDRFAIRFSNAPQLTRSTVVIESADQKPADAVQCPQQTGRASHCSTCGFCWNSERRVAFLRH